MSLIKIKQMIQPKTFIFVTSFHKPTRSDWIGVSWRQNP